MPPEYKVVFCQDRAKLEHDLNTAFDEGYVLIVTGLDNLCLMRLGGPGMPPPSGDQYKVIIAQDRSSLDAKINKAFDDGFILANTGMANCVIMRRVGAGGAEAGTGALVDA